MVRNSISLQRHWLRGCGTPYWELTGVRLSVPIVSGKSCCLFLVALLPSPGLHFWIQLSDWWCGAELTDFVELTMTVLSGFYGFI